MESRGGDEGGNQTNQIIVHVARVTKSCSAGSHDGRHLCACVCFSPFP